MPDSDIRADSDHRDGSGLGCNVQAEAAAQAEAQKAHEDTPVVTGKVKMAMTGAVICAAAALATSASTVAVLDVEKISWRRRSPAMEQPTSPRLRAGPRAAVYRTKSSGNCA